jgi:non-ribosomal peptide synthetase component F
LYNFYGPTEATIDVIYWKCERKHYHQQRIPLGKPISNTQIYIFNSKRQVLPPNIAGEIIISGDCLAKGYVNQSELTHRKFPSESYHSKEKFYCSGDSGYYDDLGLTYYLGRIDTQVKKNKRI